MGYNYRIKGIVPLSKRQKPTRKQLQDLSCSELKTRLKRIGFKIKRDFFKYDGITQKGNRLYRFRWWSGEFLVDISCPKNDFDRWANSTEKTVSVNDIIGFH